MIPTRSRWPLTLALCGGYFLVLLDVTVVNVALPEIGAQLHAGSAGLTEHVSDVLGARVGDLDCDVIGTGREHGVQTVLLTRREALPPSAENMTDPVDRLSPCGRDTRQSPAGPCGARHRPQHQRA
jgi:hypothetical protein